MHGQRNYTALGYLEFVDKEYIMNVLKACGVRRGRRQQELDSRFHEPSISDADLDHILRQHPDLAAMTTSWNAGAHDAIHFAENLGLKHGVDQASWFDPWTGTREKMSTAAAHVRDEDGQLGV